MMPEKDKEIELILGNSNPRFSGVTSTMLQVLEHQQKLVELAVMGKHHLPSSVKFISFLETARLCKAPLKNGKYRVFHARRNDEMIQALLLKWFFRAKIKIVFTSTAQRYHSTFTKWLMSKMDHVISTCEAAAGYLKQRPDAIIPHGVDTSVYYPSKSRKEDWAKLGLPGKYGIGIFGRVRHQKGIDLLVDALVPILSKYNDFTVVIVGEITSGNEKFVAEQKRKIDNAGLTERFVFKGKQPFSEIPKLFRSMSVVAALSRNEGFGLTVLEALSSGVAVVASEAGAWKEIIGDNEFGYCVPVNDASSVREKFEIFLKEPEKLEEIGKKGRSFIEKHYTVEREATSLTQFLLSVAE